MISELSLLQQGVRFVRIPDRTLGSVVKAHGPRDEALVAALREAVRERVPALADLTAARRQVWTAWQGEVAVRSGVHASGPLKGQAWSVAGLPPGVCETCGGAVCAVRAGKVFVEGGGMCAICCMSRQQVMMGRAA